MTRRTIDNSDPDELFRVRWETIADHTPRTLSVAPVTMPRSPAADDDAEVIAIAGVRRRLSAVHVAAVASLAVVGAVAVHAALQPSAQDASAAVLSKASPASAVRSMIGAGAELDSAASSASARFAWGRAVASVRETIRVDLVAARTRLFPTHIVVPVTITALAPHAASADSAKRSPDRRQAAGSNQQGQAYLMSKRPLRESGRASGAAKRQGRMFNADAPPGSTDLQWRQPARWPQPSTEAQMRPTRLEFNRSRTGAWLIQREPRRE